MIEDFQLLDNEPLDNSTIKRDFTKIYHQQEAQLKQSDQKTEFIFGENNNYHQIGNGYLEFNFTVRIIDTINFHNDDPIRIVTNDFAFCFEEASLSITLGSDIEINIFSGHVSTILKVISNEDGDLLSQFHYKNKNDIPVIERINNLPPQTRAAPHQKMFINKHTDAKKVKLKGSLYLEENIGFCETFKKVPKKFRLSSYV